MIVDVGLSESDLDLLSDAALELSCGSAEGVHLVGTRLAFYRARGIHLCRVFGELGLVVSRARGQAAVNDEEA